MNALLLITDEKAAHFTRKQFYLKQGFTSVLSYVNFQTRKKSGWVTMMTLESVMHISNILPITLREFGLPHASQNCQLGDLAKLLPLHVLVGILSLDLYVAVVGLVLF